MPRFGARGGHNQFNGRDETDEAPFPWEVGLVGKEPYIGRPTPLSEIPDNLRPAGQVGGLSKRLENGISRAAIRSLQENLPTELHQHAATYIQHLLQS